MTKRKSVDLLPVIFRTDANQRFLSGTLDQFIQQPDLKKIDGYIGDRIVKNFDPSKDSYINGPLTSNFRNSYEVEPGIILKNPVTEEVEFAKSYEDILNSLNLYGSPIENQDKLFKQQSHAWTPHIDLDKFVNYRNYVWLPQGPQTILITGQELEIVSTIYVSVSEEQGNKVWKFSNNEVAVNPTLTLYRGITYIFEVNNVDDGFFIKQSRTGTPLTVEQGVTNNGAKTGEIIFEVL
jgi:hypothetical protein